MLSPLTDADPRTVGSYRLQGRLGAGGMGAVYLGFGPDDHPVALKVIRPELAADPGFRQRFRREVAAARRVHGSFVAEVRDADVDAEQPWMATEYVEGVSLAAAMADRGRLDGRTLVDFAVGLADALVAVHGAGLVHRDLKPSNILLAWDGPKVIDFGIARDLGASDQTRTGDVIGTAAWMAPEQLLGERAGPPADIFSWAMCVVFAATGRRAFAADTPTASAFRSLVEEPDLDGIPETLTPILLNALSKNPTDRPSAVDVVSTLLGYEVTGIADADEATRRQLGTRWAPPPAPPGPAPAPPGPAPAPVASPATAPAGPAPAPVASPPPPTAPQRRDISGRRTGWGGKRLALTGAAAVALLAAGAGLALALTPGESGDASTPGAHLRTIAASPARQATAGTTMLPAIATPGTSTATPPTANGSGPAVAAAGSRTDGQSGTAPRAAAPTPAGQASAGTTALPATTAPAPPPTMPDTNGGTTNEVVYHAAGNAAGTAWFNSGTANMRKGRNSFTVKDLFCGDGWSIYVQYSYTDAQGTSRSGSKYLSGDCSPVEWSGSIVGAQPKALAFRWRGCKWDTNHRSADTCEPWITTTVR